MMQIDSSSSIGAHPGGYIHSDPGTARDRGMGSRISVPRPGGSDAAPVISPRVEKADPETGWDAADRKSTGETKEMDPGGPFSDTARTVGNRRFSEAEQRLIEQLKVADREVRAHEMAHVIAGGQFVSRGASFQYQRGPDGKRYAVAGEVHIDASEIPGDPGATAEKMERIKRAALAPAEPSNQDRRIAARAAMLRAGALMDLTLMRLNKRISLQQAGDQGNPGAVSGVYAQAAGDHEKGTAVDLIG